MTSEFGESLEAMKERMRAKGLSEDDIQQEQEIRESYERARRERATRES